MYKAGIIYDFIFIDLAINVYNFMFLFKSILIYDLAFISHLSFDYKFIITETKIKLCELIEFSSL